MVDPQDDADNQSDLSYAEEEHHWYPALSDAVPPMTEDPIRLRPVGPLEVQDLVREGGDDGDNEEEEESSEGEDVEAFVGPVGQPICPLRAQIDLPRRMDVGYLQAIVSTLIPLTPPPSSAAIIPTDWERIVPVVASPRQYTEVGVQGDLTHRLQGDVVNLMVRAEVRRTGFDQLLGEVSAIKSSLESMSGALELELAARQSRTREMPGGFQPVVLEGEWSPASEFKGGGCVSELPKDERVEE